MAISIQKTSIEGLTLIHPHVFEDQRGYLSKILRNQYMNKMTCPYYFTNVTNQNLRKVLFVDSIFNKNSLRGN